jgi:hypothetical protein
MRIVRPDVGRARMAGGVMTYRDRREARADRLRGWAGTREARAEAVFKAGEPFTSDIAFNTQPGHIPFRAKLIAREDRAYESIVKAASMRSRADGIEGQLANAIYEDDPDAVEQLRARIARLETERDAAKAVNAAYRKEHKAELKAMTLYQRDQALPYPGYHFQNLSGNLSRQRARLARLERATCEGAPDETSADDDMFGPADAVPAGTPEFEQALAASVAHLPRD